MEPFVQYLHEKHWDAKGWMEGKTRSIFDVWKLRYFDVWKLRYFDTWKLDISIHEKFRYDIQHSL